MRKRENKPYSVVLALLCAMIVFNGCSSEFRPGNAGVANLAATSAQAQSPVEGSDESTRNLHNKQFTLAQLQEDFGGIRETMANFHPRLYTDEEELETLLASQYIQLEEGMTAIDFYRVTAPIISASRCGHTYIGLSEQDSTTFLASAQFLPFSLYWQNKRALVNANALIPQLPIGTQVLSINGVKIEEVMAGLMQNLASDGENQTQKIRAINDGFRYHYAMDNPTPDEISVEYIGPDQGVKRSLVIQTVSKSDLEAAGDSVWGHMSRLSRENGSSYEKDHAYMRMASFYPSGGASVDSYKTFIDDFFAKVKQDQIENVVIDVRDNSGGDPNVAAHLLSCLEKTEVPYFDEKSGSYYPHLMKPVPFADNRFSGKLYVLMNGNCFSTTGHFLALLKYHGIGTLIGEESGASFACSDASVTVNLPHTNLMFKSSRRIFQVAVEGLTPGRGVFPDYPVVATLDEILSGKDVEMAKALELMEKP